jgi:crotonobetainyl-CoA:carnitine CoA-transferase CaiB-like acyl-CoA transferase
MAQGPLSGIRVVEWAHVHFGPGAGMFLGDMGADVIRVESPEGDQMRRFGTLWGVDFMLEHDRNSFTEDLLRNKRSIALDLNDPDAKEIVYRLVDEADVFLTNFRPAAATRQLLDYGTLSARNPNLIYAQGTSYGPEGPEKDAPGLEMMGLGRGGMMLGSTEPGGEPVFPTMGLNDRLGSIGLLVAILGALMARERTGEAQLVETSLLGWMVNLQAAAVSCAANTGQDVRPLPRRDQDDPLYNWYRLEDGTWIALGMIVNPHKYWPLLCQAIERPELTDDPRFTDQSRRRENNRALIDILDEVFATMSWERWDAKIHEYELISCRINALTDLTRDEQIIANDYLVKRPHPDLGEFWYIPTPVHFEKTPVSVRSAAPQVGENSAEVLGELGYSEEEIDDLRRREVVWTSARTPSAAPR